MTATNATPACWSWPMPTEAVDDPYVALVRWHDGRCGLCGKPETARKYRGTAPRGLCEDHNHETGLTRGFLCRRCNLHEGKCSEPSCACAGWRVRPAADVLGLSIEHARWDTSVDAQFRREGILPEEGRRDAMRRVSAVLSGLFDDEADSD